MRDLNSQIYRTISELAQITGPETSAQNNRHKSPMSPGFPRIQHIATNRRCLSGARENRILRRRASVVDVKDVILRAGESWQGRSEQQSCPQQALAQDVSVSSSGSHSAFPVLIYGLFSAHIDFRCTQVTNSCVGSAKLLNSSALPLGSYM